MCILPFMFSLDTVALTPTRMELEFCGGKEVEEKIDILHK